MKAQATSTPVWLMLAGLITGQQAALAYDWLPPTNKIVLLAVWSHADDEGIFGGGSLPYYSTVLNLPTMTICMADRDPVREEELRCAAWSYGLRYEPIFGHFSDYNTLIMTNCPYTNTLDACWDLWADGVLQGDGRDVEAGKTRAINFVAEQIRRYRPEVIITHDLNGETEHDNHKATAYAVTHAFYVAADPNATATNLVGLAPWQAQKLYVHLYGTNRLFHDAWEVPFPALSNRTPHQAVNQGLTCHVSQGSGRWTCASVYPPAGWYTIWPSEWWGLYASAVGPDTIVSSNRLVNGYSVPGGVAVGNFLEHVALGPAYQPPAFRVNPLTLPTAATSDPLGGYTLADYVISSDPVRLLSFGKVSGPAWLSVARDGTLGGVPSHNDAGTNFWIVGVTNQGGLTAEAAVTLTLVGRPIGQENLMGWWKLNETNPASPVALNSAPLSPDGMSSGGTIFGQDGSRPWNKLSARFDGTSGKIDVPYTASLNPPVFTVALWANVAARTGDYRSPLTSRQGSPLAGYMFYAAVNDVWQFRFGTGGGAWTVLNAGPVVTNTWVHLAATYDGATVCFYVNGTLAAGTKAAFQANRACPLRIGAGATEGAGAYWFPGWVDDVRVYRVALDPTQIRAVYAAPPVIGGIVRQSDRSMLVQGIAEPGQTCILLSTESQGTPPTWRPVATNVADDTGQIQFVDADVAIHAIRFYRLARP